MILGYVEQPSPRAGDTATLRVATRAPRFRVDVYRCGNGLERVHRTGWLSGCEAPLHLPWHDWGRPNTGLHGEPLAPWQAYPLEVGRSWRPGVYVAVLVEEGADDAAAADAPTHARGRHCSSSAAPPDAGIGHPSSTSCRS